MAMFIRCTCLVDTEEICILYDDGLIVTQMATGRRCGSALLPSSDPVFEILVIIVLLMYAL